jgi:hypothetical protein
LSVLPRYLHRLLSPAGLEELRRLASTGALFPVMTLFPAPRGRQLGSLAA